LIDPQVTLYDTAGMERFEGTIPPTYFRSAKVVIFVYSITENDSISNIESWMDSVSPQRIGAGGIIRALVGNKVDMEADREVDTERGRQVAENCGIDRDLFFEISALEGTGFDDMFQALVRAIRNFGKEEALAGISLSANDGKRTDKKTGCACGK
jgi:GTPase SAR1 family protein